MILFFLLIIWDGGSIW